MSPTALPVWGGSDSGRGSSKRRGSCSGDRWRSARSRWDRTIPTWRPACSRLAELSNAIGRHAESEPLARRSLEILRKSKGEMNTEVAGSMTVLAEALRGVQKVDESESLLLSVVEDPGSSRGRRGGQSRRLPRGSGGDRPGSRQVRRGGGEARASPGDPGETGQDAPGCRAMPRATRDSRTGSGKAHGGGVALSRGVGRLGAVGARGPSRLRRATLQVTPNCSADSDGPTTRTRCRLARGPSSISGLRSTPRDDPPSGPDPGDNPVAFHDTAGDGRRRAWSRTSCDKPVRLFRGHRLRVARPGLTGSTPSQQWRRRNIVRHLGRGRIAVNVVARKTRRSDHRVSSAT